MRERKRRRKGERGRERKGEKGKGERGRGRERDYSLVCLIRTLTLLSQSATLITSFNVNNFIFIFMSKHILDI